MPKKRLVAVLIIFLLIVLTPRYMAKRLKEISNQVKIENNYQDSSAVQLEKHTAIKDDNPIESIQGASTIKEKIVERLKMGQKMN